MPLGLCLDTAHAHGAGYDLSLPAGVARLLADLARGPGLDAVKIVHLNDSRVACNSRRDRHWHLGQGAIGLAGLRHLFSHPWFKPEAAIMETPKPHQAYEWYNLLVARSLVPGTLLLPRARPALGARPCWPGIVDRLWPLTSRGSKGNSFVGGVFRPEGAQRALRFVLSLNRIRPEITFLRATCRLRPVIFFFTGGTLQVFDKFIII